MVNSQDHVLVYVLLGWAFLIHLFVRKLDGPLSFFGSCGKEKFPALPVTKPIGQ
jgi:hypothetical protein